MRTVATINESIVIEMFTRACALWTSRHALTRSMNHDVIDLILVDDRLRAQLDGLAAAGDDGWTLIVSEVDRRPRGAAFVTTVVAGLSGDRDRIEWSVRHHLGSEDDVTQLGAALSWLPFSRIADTLTAWASYDDPRWRALALSGYCDHRYAPPMSWISMAIDQPNELWQREGIRAAGLFPFSPRGPIVTASQESQSLDIQFEAARTLLRSGVALAREMLWEHTLLGGPHTEAAAVLACRHAPLETVEVWASLAMRSRSRLQRAALLGMASTGSLRFVPTLLDALDDPGLAPTAAYGLYMIAGLDLDACEAVTDHVSASTAPPVPHAGAVREWWSAHRHLFDPATRWFVGHARDVVGFRDALCGATQHARELAADDLRQLRGAGTVPLNIAAPGWRQLRWLNRATQPRHPSPFGPSSGAPR